ncbi:MAG: hypothetical protein QXH17_09150 [Candidatus Bathyarchaeia archaeon]
MTECDRLREEIRKLFLRHATGDIRERAFQRLLAQLSIALYRTFVKGHMAEGETILQEHHVIKAHTRLTQSVLKEPEQESISLFATDRRLIRLRSIWKPGQAVTCDSKDRTVIDYLPFESIRGFQTHRQIRPGEIIVGFAMGGVALIFYPYLELTGPILLGIGALGVFHGLLMPTRWIEIKAEGSSIDEPILIYATRKKSARRLLGLIEEKARCFLFSS